MFYEILIRIVGFIIGAGMLFGLIGFLAWAIYSICNPNTFRYLNLPWMPDENRAVKEQNDGYDPRRGVRLVPHPKPRKPKRQKPEWWRFLTEESIGSLLEKRRQKKAAAKARKNDPWQDFE